MIVKHEGGTLRHLLVWVNFTRTFYYNFWRELSLDHTRLYHIMLHCLRHLRYYDTFLPQFSNRIKYFATNTILKSLLDHTRPKVEKHWDIL